MSTSASSLGLRRAVSVGAADYRTASSGVAESAVSLLVISIRWDPDRETARCTGCWGSYRVRISATRRSAVVGLPSGSVLMSAAVT